MNRIIFICVLMLLLSAVSLPAGAQSYGQMWKEVESLKKKDQPKSVICQVEKIYVKAASEKNAPQMLKAFLVRMKAKTDISLDSLFGETETLRRWTFEEKDTLTHAVLNHIMAVIQLEKQPADVDSAVWYFRESLKYPYVLAKVTAEEFRPMTESGKLSEKYYGNTMLDLLVRQAIYRLSCKYADVSRSKESGRAVLELYDSLISYYEKSGNRQAELLTRLCLLSYRQGSEQVSPLKLSGSEEKTMLAEWMEEYADVEVCAAVYVQMTEIFYRDKQFVEAMRTIEEGLKRYPQSEFASDLEVYRRRILSPSLQMSTEWTYPNADAIFKVQSKNLAGVTLEVYRLDLEASSSVLVGGMKRKAMVEEYGKIIDRQHFALPSTPEYKDTVSSFTYRMPDPGIYMLKSVPDGYNDKEEYELVYLSSLQIISFPLDGKETEYYVVDRMTGHPVPEAEIMFYTVTNPGNYTFCRSFKTDNGGRAVVPEMKERRLWINARKGTDNFMRIYYVSSSGRLYVPSEKGETYSTQLYTDRALYRPGQTIYVSGVAYRQEGDDTKVRDGWNFTLTLRDANGRELSKKELVTDDFGGFRAEFPLPQSLLFGNLRLEAEHGSCVVRVDEYKRPTFDVVFQSYNDAYAMGDTLSLDGVAMNFSGVPVRDGKVRYTVTRSQAWIWRAGRTSTEIIGTGETQTDSNGKFHLETILQKPETGIDRWNSYYMYEVTADVVDMNGESQSGSLSLPVGMQSMGLMIDGLRTKVMREKNEEIQFLARNLNGQSVYVTVNYRIYAIDVNDEKGRLVAQGEQSSHTAFVLGQLSDLSSGRYRMEIFSTDNQGRECRAGQDFVLFSKEDVNPPYETAEWFYQDGTEFSEQNPVTLYIGSSERDVCVFYSVFCRDKRIHSEQFMLGNEIRKFVYPYKEEYGDGITVSFSFVRKGVFYTKQVSVTRPKPDKKLTLKWKSFRDNLVPGGHEEWILNILDKDGKPADARFFVTLYDASLDRLVDNRWSFGLEFRRYTPYVRPRMYGMNAGCTMYSTFYNHYKSDVYDFDSFDGYSRLFVPSLRKETIYDRGGKIFNARGVDSSAGLYQAAAKNMTQETTLDEGFEEYGGMENVVQPASVDSESGYIPLRGNFAETVFFCSDLRTDSVGDVRMVFTMPDAVTEWSLTGMAHTRNVDYGLITAMARTGKRFMVQPNMPRFVRVGDRALIATLLDNLSGEAISGTVRMQLINPLDDSVVYESEQAFSVEENRNGTVCFEYEVTDRYDVLVCRIVAEAGEYSDGEQHYLPILTDKQWVTETLPFQLKESEEKVIELDDMFNRQSSTATCRRLTVELTSNPLWYVVQALPVLSNPESEDVFSLASAYYANVLAKKILEKNPKIQQVLGAWTVHNTDTDVWLSELEKNQDLKNILLEDTPWIAAADETERKRRIAALFDPNRMETSLRESVSRLAKLQNADGSWPWYEGMDGSRIVTTGVAELVARLKSMMAWSDMQMDGIYMKACDWLTVKMREEYDMMKRNEKVYGKSVLPSNLAVKYLYICALDGFAASRADEAVNAYMLEKLLNRSSEYNIREKAIIAVIMHEYGKTDEAEALVRSVKEYSVYTSETGRYFDTSKAPYSWNGHKIPTQVAAMEAVSKVEPDTAMLSEMQQWLIKQKQVQVWGNSLETSDAVYALLCSGSNLSQPSGKMTVKAEGVLMETPENVLGYTRQTYSGNETAIKRMEVYKAGEGTGWGAVYAQYLENMDKLNDVEGNGLHISREILKDGKRISDDIHLKVGDKLTVRLNVKADCDMDFIQIRDERPACFEPVEQLSGYRRSRGTGFGYYQVNRDVSSEFFIDRMRKGTYVIEYAVYVDRAGVYQAGMADIQSAYAPEFSGHAGGMKVEVYDK